MANILIATVPLLSEIKIVRYLETITVHVVLGVNFFSDFAASITDMVGGNSEIYQGKLDTITNQVNSIVRDKAKQLGANAIIDYKLQFNEISGKGKQMFMVTATGTACKIAMPENETVDKIEQVSFAQIRRQYLINLYSRRIEQKGALSNTDWENIISLQLSELADGLTKEYIRLMTDKQSGYDQISYRDNFADLYVTYLSEVPKQIATPVLNQYLPQASNLMAKLIIKQNLFCPKEIIKLLSEPDNIDVAIRLLQAHKESYTLQDLNDMKQIICMLDNLPDKGSYQIRKHGVFSKKEEEMFVCPSGHVNARDEHFCSDGNCGLNIKGLTEDQVNVINRFKGIVEALDNILQ